MEFNQNRFSTIWCGLIDFANHSITYASGGHPAPFFFGPDLRAEPIFGGGLLETSRNGTILGREGFQQWLLGNYSRPNPRLSHLIDRLEACSGGPT